jgi:dTDP-4-dehydrorhamnose reductase
MTTILVTGATGFLGRTLCRLRPEGVRLVPASRSGEGHIRLDLTDSESVLRAVEEAAPECVIHTAAFTSVDGCEADPEAARRVHVDGTRALVEACEKSGAYLIALSSNYVFDGRSGPYAEEDAPNPLNVYGSTKLEAERIVIESEIPAAIVRTAVLYGASDGRPDFVTWAATELALKNAIRVVTDEWSNPTSVDELANSLLYLNTPRGRRHRGLIHLAGVDFMTRYEMVEAIAEAFGLDTENVHPVTSADLAQKAERPLRAGLRTDLAETLIPGPRESFKESLKAVVAQTDLASLTRS